jgi:ubiquinone/menaquinone biosynthesis C-methylase UbiE
VDIQRIYRPVLTHFRRRRMRVFFEALHITSETKILDVGGSAFIWKIAAEHGLPQPQITILNLFEKDTPITPNMRWIVGNGCNLPFADREFDVVFSNSVIEHLGNHDSQLQFAREIERVGREYWVQTPDPKFFIEPHYLAPFIHWLPVEQRRKLARWGTMWGLIAHPNKAEIEARLKEIRLINDHEFVKMFPDAEVIHERWFGMRKSLIAKRQTAYAA